MTIHNRRPEDVDACVALLERVAGQTDYPVHYPANPHSWLTKGDPLAAWVSECDGDIVGHAYLRSAVGDLAADQWSTAVGVPDTQLAMLSRLFVDPDMHGLGIGTQLIETALLWAQNNSRKLVFDVAAVHTDTIAFYQRHGWTVIGETTIPLPTGVDLPVVLFAHNDDLKQTK